MPIRTSAACAMILQLEAGQAGQGLAATLPGAHDGPVASAVGTAGGALLGRGAADTRLCRERASKIGTWRRALAEEQDTHRLLDQNRFCPRQLDNAVRKNRKTHWMQDDPRADDSWNQV